MTASIAILAALPEELAPLRRRLQARRVETIGRHRFHAGTLEGRPVVMLAGGDGIVRAREAADLLLERFDVSLLIGIGIGGALTGDLLPGDIVTGEKIGSPDGSSYRCDSRMLGLLPFRRVSIATANRIVGTPEARRCLAESTGALVVDTESSAWAAAASNRSIPFVSLRVIFDPATEQIPSFVTSGDAIDRASIVRHAALHPGVIPSLLRMRRHLANCAARLESAVVTAVSAGHGEFSISCLEDLLAKTSRTFALCIPLLDERTRAEVTIAYLLFRIADTFEDASEWTVPEKTEALAGFCRLLRNQDLADARLLSAGWVARCPSHHPGYLELLAETPRVIEALNCLSLETREVIVTHVVRSAEGMSGYVNRTSADGLLALEHLADLGRYCYTVAGIVGEMLTELFMLGAPEVAPSALFLRSRSAAFGEALQLVNILKDAVEDAREGRTYIPGRSSHAEVLALARADLDSATEYTLALQEAGAPRGMVAFVALPAALAAATLDRLERVGPGAKLTRPEVFRIMRRLNRALDRNEPVLTTNPPATAATWRRSILAILSGNGN